MSEWICRVASKGLWHINRPLALRLWARADGLMLERTGIKTRLRAMIAKSAKPDDIVKNAP